jgi:N6-adenosine-specific RNA methylase IME4
MNGPYKVIVADPAWPVKKIIRRVRPNQKSALDYPTMLVDEIARLDVESLADNNAVLGLWTTHAFLRSAFDVMDAWGFKYQRCLTWDKHNGMSLFGFHHRTEFCLFGYRGHIEMYPRRPTIPTVFEGKSVRHSAKPDIFFDMIGVFGSPRLEMFARQSRPGWDVWGNEVESDVEIKNHDRL